MFGTTTVLGIWDQSTRAKNTIGGRIIPCLELGSGIKTRAKNIHGRFRQHPNTLCSMAYLTTLLSMEGAAHTKRCLSMCTTRLCQAIPLIAPAVPRGPTHGASTIPLLVSLKSWNSRTSGDYECRERVLKQYCSAVDWKN